MLQFKLTNPPTKQTTEIYTYTAPPESPPSINNGDDVLRSADIVYKNLTTPDPQTGLSPLADYDAVLVACFSVHPLVERLADLEFPASPTLACPASTSSNHHSVPKRKLCVTGIFEAGVLASLSLVTTPPLNTVPPRKWGIVTTGKWWEAHLTQGVNTFLGVDPKSLNDKFAGVETTGLDAGDFHGGVSPEVIRQKLTEATKRLLSQGAVDCVVMGCAGMAGLEEIIRSAAIEKYGEEQGKQVCIVDGVRAGVGLLEDMVRNRRMFTQ